jgi:hypothetical protein
MRYEIAYIYRPQSYSYLNLIALTPTLNYMIQTRSKYMYWV